MFTYEKDAKIVFLFGSKYPGTGLSTVSKWLAEALGFKFFEAGQIRRKIVLHWEQFLRTKTSRTAEATEQEIEQFWPEFVDLYASYLNNPAELWDKIQTFDGSAGEDALESFNTLSESHPLFYKVPETIAAYVLSLDLEPEFLGIVYAGKLATLIDYLVQENIPGIVIMRVFFSVDEEESAKRVLKREIEKGNVIYEPTTDGDYETWYANQLAAIKLKNRNRMDHDKEMYARDDVFSLIGNLFDELNELYGILELDTTTHDLDNVKNIVRLMALAHITRTEKDNKIAPAVAQLLIQRLEDAPLVFEH